MRHKLRKVRLDSKLTQQEISDKLGISRAYYSNIELGHKNPSLSTAFKIKEVLKYENDDIFLNLGCRKDTLKETETA